MAEATGYLVLSLHPERARDAATATTEPTGGAWHEVAVVDATSASQAIRKSGGTGVLVAVPARSWKPVRVVTETITRVKLEEA